jgi:transposase-like protein
MAGVLVVDPGGSCVDVIRLQERKRAYPAAVACLVDDFASLAVHLRFPAEHWRRIRHTNLISVNPNLLKAPG